MSDTEPLRTLVGGGPSSYRVRPASPSDVPQIAVVIGQLLTELGGAPPASSAMQEVTHALLEDGEAGAILLAEANEELVGVLAASWQSAIHIPGRYALIQDLWVHPAWRSRAIGAALIEALSGLATEQGIPRLEVGLPRESFASVDATEAFYRANGFTPLGPRMRRVLG
jgi:GNAT superfamily N-acetyltransferase